MPDLAAVGIDLGTTRIKAALVDLHGSVLAVEDEATPWDARSGDTELDVRDVADAAIRVACRVAEAGRAAGLRVCAIGTTGMAETGALLGADGSPMAPGYAWHHTLGSPDRLRRELGHDTFITTTGRDSGIAPSIVKLDWLRTRGHVFQRGQRWLTVPEYVAWRLGGEQCAELAEASRTGLLDIARRTWWDDALEFLGAGRWLLPGEPVPGGTLLGRVRNDLPEALRGAAVAVGGHDHPVAGIGVGGSDEGCLSLSLGTAEAQLRVVPPQLGPEVVRRVVELGGNVDWHPLGDRWSVLAPLPTGMTLARLAAVLGVGTPDARIALSRLALEQPWPAPIQVRLTDVTYDAFTIEGITDGISRTGVWRSAVEQLVHRSWELTTTLESVLGARTRAVAFGGWIHDPLVREVRSRLLGPGTSYSPVPEPGATGAALLAARGAGAIESLPGAGAELTGGATDQGR